MLHASTAPTASLNFTVFSPPSHSCLAFLVTLQGKAQPQQLMRVGSTLYRRAMSFTVTSPKPLSVIRGIEEDGTAQLSALAAGCCEEVRHMR